MKNVLINLCIFAIIIVAGSLGCQKEEISRPKSIHPFDHLLNFRNWDPDEEIPADIYITMIANGQAFASEVATVEVLAYFKNPSGAFANIDSMFINDINIPIVPDSTGKYRRVFGFNLSDRSDLDDALEVYGDDMLIDIYGSYPMHSFDNEYYLPAIINLIAYNHGGGVIDPNEDLEVTWNADPNNEKVNIGLFYIPRNSLLNPVHKVYTTDDDGSFTVPSADLQSFPEGYEINIGIARGFINDKEIVTDYVVRTTGITYSFSEPILVEEK